MSLLQKIRRWALLPLSVVAVIIGTVGYSFSAVSAYQLKLEETAVFAALEPSEVHVDLWIASADLEKYIQYVGTGQVSVHDIFDRKTYSLVPRVTETLNSRISEPQSGQLAIFVPARYQGQPPAVLNDILKNLKTRRDIAAIQRDAAKVYLDILVAGIATLLLILFLPKALKVRQIIPFARIWRACVQSWRKLMVLGSVIWAVFATWETNPYSSSEYAIIVGPFVIALAVYFLFPSKRPSYNR